MKPKLKEDPKEWLKFTGVTALLPGVMAALLYHRKAIALPVLVLTVALMIAAILLCWARPAWFRSFYRVGMTASFHVGQVMGFILLTVFFLVIVSPLGLLLRLAGKDLLQLKRRHASPTYWRPARTSTEFDRQF